jgi:hypothetical protein
MESKERGGGVQNKKDVWMLLITAYYWNTWHDKNFLWIKKIFNLFPVYQQPAR